MVFFCISDKPYTGHYHIKTPLIFKSYDLDVGWVVLPEYCSFQFSKCCLQNLLFSHIYMWPIGFNWNMSGTHWFQRFLKHCKTYISYLWTSISPTSKLYVYVWHLFWRFTTVCLYGFEYLINVIRKPSWSFAHILSQIFFLDIFKSFTCCHDICAFSADTFLLWWLWEYVYFLLASSNRKSTFSHFRGLGHEAMVCAVCRPMFKMVVHL